MALSELSRYRINAVNRFADETATAALQGEDLQRKEAERQARRSAIARVVGGFSSAGGPENVYDNTMRAVTGLIGVGGEEADRAAATLLKTPEAYAHLHPSRIPAAAKRRFVAVAESPDVNRWPLTRTRGNQVESLEQEIDDANQPTGFYQYSAGGKNEKPDKGDEAGARQERADIQKQKDALNQASAATKSYEDRFGTDTLKEWTALLEKEQPNIMAIAADPNIPEDQKGQQLMAALGAVADPVLKGKLTAASNYAVANAKKQGYGKNIEDRGYFVDDNGTLVKGKKPVAAPVPAPQKTKDEMALEWANANPNDPRAAKVIEKLKAKANF